MDKRSFFGTDGLRARVGSATMTPVFLIQLGWSIGNVLKQSVVEKPRILIGRDTRISGDMIQSALVSGLLAAGCDVTLLGVLPTPAIAYLTKKYEAAAGIVISASHNPFEDNGIKCIGSDGMKLPDSWELKVEHFLQQPMTLTEQRLLGTVDVMLDASKEYVSHCQALFSFKMKHQLVLDCANGATSVVAPEILSGLGATILAIHDQPDGININKNCGATSTASLQKKVVAENAACGLAFDGDGDRLIMVDHLGEVVDGDEILGIIATHGDFAGVAGTLMTNLGLEKALAANQIAFERTAVGDRYVLAALLEKNWELGGEASGHVINLKYSPTGDGIFTALQVLKIMQETGESLHKLKQVVKKRPQILVNVSVENPKSFSDIPIINEAVVKVQAELGKSGRVLLRASGTESCVRVMVECDDANHATAYAQSLAKTVKSAFLKV